MPLGKYGDMQASNVEKIGRIWQVKRLGEKAIGKIKDDRYQSIRNCCNICLNMKGENEIMPIIDIIKKGESYSYNGVCYCKRIWGCCLCSSLVGALRSLEIRKAIIDWCGSGHSCLMVTLTCQHDKYMNLQFILLSLQDARKRFYEDGSVKRFFSKMALGRVWVLEITDSENNGWHCHTHNLYFCFEKQKYDIKDFIYCKWKKCLNSVGLDCDYEHGVDLLSTLDVSKYLTKMSAELSLGQVTKVGRYNHYTPFQLLLEWKKGDDWALEQYKNYLIGTYRLKVLTWQRGLKKFFGLLDDEELDEYVLKKEKLFSLSNIDYYNLDTKKRGFLLSNAPMDEKLDLLEQIGVEPYFAEKYDFLEELPENKFMRNYQLELPL